jgi:hypothetical protein
LSIGDENRRHSALPVLRHYRQQQAPEARRDKALGIHQLAPQVVEFSTQVRRRGPCGQPPYTLLRCRLPSPAVTARPLRLPRLQEL